VLKNNTYWSNVNPRKTFELSVHYQKFGVWRATITRTVGEIVFKTIEQKEHTVSIYCDTKFLKHPDMQVSIIREIITETRNCFLSADDADVSGAQADSKKARLFPMQRLCTLSIVSYNFDIALL
jgi:hypothetical protein